MPVEPPHAAGPPPDVAGRPVVERPVVERPVVERPVVERPVVERPVIERPVDERRPVTREVSCARCGAVVLAAKFSPQQTSLQWTPAAVRSCAEFAARVAAGEQTALIDSCASLRDSIDAAVLDGRLPVASPVPDAAAPEAVTQ